MFQYTMTIEPSNAAMALEVLEHIKAAVEAMARSASDKIKAATASASPVVAATPAEPEPDADAPKPKPRPRKPAAKKAVTPPADDDADETDAPEMDRDAMIVEARKAGKALGDATSVPEVVKLVAEHGGKKYSDLSDDQLQTFIADANNRVAEAALAD